MAFRMLMREERTTLVSRLNRTISCTSTVFMLCVNCVCVYVKCVLYDIADSLKRLTCVYVVGYFLRASSVSKLLGSLLTMSVATSSRISSFDLPPPDVVRACMHV